MRSPTGSLPGSPPAAAGLADPGARCPVHPREPAWRHRRRPGHVPAAFSGNCTPTATDPANGLWPPCSAPRLEIRSAAYFRYDSLAALENAFAAVLADAGAITEGTDCSVGPALVDYTVGDRPAGRLACYLADGTAVALWTNMDLLMMGMGAEASGDFGRLFTWWQDAGPLS